MASLGVLPIHNEILMVKNPYNYYLLSKISITWVVY